MKMSKDERDEFVKAMEDDDALCDMLRNAFGVLEDSAFCREEADAFVACNCNDRDCSCRLKS